MKAIIQRVDSASVTVENNLMGKIGSGLLIMLGIQRGDKLKDMKYLINKITTLRIFNDNNGMNKSIQDVSGEILVISQFTLCADTKKGRRPSFINAENPKIAKELYELFCQFLDKMNLQIQCGTFGAHMKVQSVNNGPVTIILDSKN